MTRRRRIAVSLACGYVLLLVASNAVRWLSPPVAEPSPGERVVRVRSVSGDTLGADDVRLVYQDFAGPGPGAPTILLLHGSPGHLQDFDRLARDLRGRARLIVPDLPGFGASTRALPDYSLHAQAQYLVQLLDACGIGPVHVVAFSQGGGVALELAALQPARVASISMVAAIGVQELELLGEFHLNRLIHGLQLGVVEAIHFAFPHFGWLDRSPIGPAYARSFLATDQRPLRGILENFEPPMLILHGRDDVLVPVEAALEHHRIVPQSELVLFDAGHLLVYGHADALSEQIADFVDRVESGQAPRRADATAERVTAAAQPFDASLSGPRSGIAVVVFVLLVTLASLVSEDLTCIGVGLLVGRGNVPFVLGAGACTFALVTGDLLLYGAGRLLGPSLLRYTPLRRAVDDSGQSRVAARLRRRGAAAIIASRFVPGLRLPTFAAAGALRYPLGRFFLFLVVAGLLWTPALVAMSAALGAATFDLLARYERFALPGFVGVVLVLWLLTRVLPQLATWGGRRRLVGRWRRLRHYEFWPTWVFYAPVLVWIAWLGLRHRSLATVTAANPGIPAGGGLVGESKREILARYGGPSARVARTGFVPAAAPLDERLACVEAFLREHALEPPFILKPDVGERGKDVERIADLGAALDYLRRHEQDTLVQEYVGGLEFGIFYVRHPEAGQGRVAGIIEKQMPRLVGTGRHRLEALILRDERAVCMADFHLARHRDRLDQVLAEGEVFPLVEIGTHSKGCVFRDGRALWSEALEQSVEQVARGFPGFHFGRFDVRCPSTEALREGRDWVVIELNGLTGEPGQIYDPDASLLAAWRTLFSLWAEAFAIGASNRRAGAPVLSLGEAFALWRRGRVPRDQRRSMSLGSA